MPAPALGADTALPLLLASGRLPPAAAHCPQRACAPPLAATQAKFFTLGLYHQREKVPTEAVLRFRLLLQRSIAVPGVSTLSRPLALSCARQCDEDGRIAACSLLRTLSIAEIHPCPAWLRQPLRHARGRQLWPHRPGRAPPPPERGQRPTSSSSSGPRASGEVQRAGTGIQYPDWDAPNLWYVSAGPRPQASGAGGAGRGRGLQQRILITCRTSFPATNPVTTDLFPCLPAAVCNPFSSSTRATSSPCR